MIEPSFLWCKQRGIDQSTTNQRTVGTMFAVFICIYHVYIYNIYVYVIYHISYIIYHISISISKSIYAVHSVQSNSWSCWWHTCLNPVYVCLCVCSSTPNLNEHIILESSFNFYYVLMCSHGMKYG